MRTYTAALKDAVKTARKEDPRQIGRALVVGTEYTVRVESIRLMPRGGPQRAFAYWYSLEDKQGASIGTIDRADSFISWANTYLKKVIA